MIDFVLVWLCSNVSDCTLMQTKNRTVSIVLNIGSFYLYIQAIGKIECLTTKLYCRSERLNLSKSPNDDK